jgi:hypothetical protein
MGGIGCRGPASVAVGRLGGTGRRRQRSRHPGDGRLGDAASVGGGCPARCGRPCVEAAMGGSSSAHDGRRAAPSGCGARGRVDGGEIF